MKIHVSDGIERPQSFSHRLLPWLPKSFTFRRSDLDGEGWTDTDATVGDGWQTTANMGLGDIRVGAISYYVFFVEKLCK